MFWRAGRCSADDLFIKHAILGAGTGLAWLLLDAQADQSSEVTVPKQKYATVLSVVIYKSWMYL